MSTGLETDADRLAYDAGDVEPVEIKIKAEDYPVCFVSSMKRAIETAKMVYTGSFIITDDLVEVKNGFSFIQKIKLPLLLRNAAGRIAWFLNSKSIPETKQQSKARAKKFISMLLNFTHENTLLVTHGFFIHCLKHELRKNGFKGRVPLYPKNARLYIFEKK